MPSKHSGIAPVHAMAHLGISTIPSHVGSRLPPALFYHHRTGYATAPLNASYRLLYYQKIAGVSDTLKVGIQAQH